MGTDRVKRARAQRSEARAKELGAPVVVTARYPPALVARIEAAAKAAGVARQEWLNRAALAYLAGLDE